MAEEERVEDDFFQKAEKQDTGSGFFRAMQKPPSTARRVTIGASIAAIAIAVFVFAPRAEEAKVWVVNPGPDPVHVVVGGEEHDVDPGKLVETSPTVEEKFEVGAFRGDQTEDIPVSLKSNKVTTTIVDLAGDAAYVILDVSAFYADTPGTSFPMIHESSPKKVHELPYSPNKLVRPGSPLPEKGSWELQVFQSPDKGIEIFKVFRVDPKRLANKDELLKVLSGAVVSKQTSEYENMRAIIDLSKVGQ
jgi:hypothetical protein